MSGKIAAVKVLLHSEHGLSSEAREKIRRVVGKETRFVAAVGKDCYAIEDFVDELSENLDTYIATSSHPAESLVEVSSLMMQFERESMGESYSLVRI